SGSRTQSVEIWIGQLGSGAALSSSDPTIRMRGTTSNGSHARANKKGGPFGPPYIVRFSNPQILRFQNSNRNPIWNTRGSRTAITVRGERADSWKLVTGSALRTL